MIIIGAGGFAREVFQDVVDSKGVNGIYFFDDINPVHDTLLYGEFEIIKTIDQVKMVFDGGNCDYIIGIGQPELR